MTINRLYKTIDIMRETYPFDKEDATIVVEERPRGDTVKIVTTDRENNTGIILSKYVDWRDEI